MIFCALVFPPQRHWDSAVDNKFDNNAWREDGNIFLWVSRVPIHIIRKPRRVFELLTSDFRLPTFNFWIPTSVATEKAVVGLHDFLCQNAACFNNIFCSCWVDYAMEGSTLLSKCDCRRLFHTERSWHTYRIKGVFLVGRICPWWKNIFFGLI